MQNRPNFPQADVIRQLSYAYIRIYLYILVFFSLHYLYNLEYFDDYIPFALYLRDIFPENIMIYSGVACYFWYCLAGSIILGIEYGQLYGRAISSGETPDWSRQLRIIEIIVFNMAGKITPISFIFFVICLVTFSPTQPFVKRLEFSFLFFAAIVVASLVLIMAIILLTRLSQAFDASVAAGPYVSIPLAGASFLIILWIGEFGILETTTQSLLHYVLAGTTIFTLTIISFFIIFNISMRLIVLLANLSQQACEYTRHIRRYGGDYLVVTGAMRLMFIQFTAQKAYSAMILSSLFYALTRFVDIRWCIVFIITTEVIALFVGFAYLAKDFDRNRYYYAIKSTFPFAASSVFVLNSILIFSYMTLHFVGFIFGVMPFSEADGLIPKIFLDIVQQPLSLEILAGQIEGAILGSIVVIFLTWLFAIWMRGDAKKFFAIIGSSITLVIAPIGLTYLDEQSLSFTDGYVYTPRIVLVAIVPSIIMFVIARIADRVSDRLICRNCGFASVPERSRFCPDCGAEIDVEISKGPWG